MSCNKLYISLLDFYRFDRDHYVIGKNKKVNTTTYNKSHFGSNVSIILCLVDCRCYEFKLNNTETIMEYKTLKLNTKITGQTIYYNVNINLLSMQKYRTE